MKDEAKCTEINDVALEVGLELRLVKLERTQIQGVAFTLDIDRDLGSPINVADVSVLDVAPLCVDPFVERLEYADILLDFSQLSLLGRHARLGLLHLVRIVTRQL